MPVVDLLEKERKEINDHIKALKAELRDIDVALSAISSKKTTKKVRRNRLGTDMKIDDAIIEAVKNGRGAPVAILEFLDQQLGIETTINSVRTRLSRLKSDDKIGHDNTGWIPIGKVEPPTESSEGGSSVTGEDDASPSMNWR